MVGIGEILWSEQSGLPLLLITHDPLLAERCERQLRIEDGRIVADSGR